MGGFEYPGLNFFFLSVFVFKGGWKGLTIDDKELTCVVAWGGVNGMGE